MDNQQSWRSRLLGYTFALVLTGLATLTSIIIYPTIQRTPAVLFFCAVVLSAWNGGLGPGVLASVLSMLALDYFLFYPTSQWSLAPTDVLNLSVFFLTGLLVSALAGMQNRAQQLVKSHREWLQTTLTSIGDAVIVTDVAGCVTFLNSIAETLTGWTTAEAIGKDIHLIFNIVNQETRLTVDNPIERVLHEGVVVGLANHTILIAKDGREIPIDDSGAPVRDSQGKLSGAVLIFRDITERRKIQRQQAMLAAIVESSDDAIIGKDLNGIITSWNKGAERMYGYAADEIVGKPISVLIPPSWRDDTTEMLERIKRGEHIVHYETKRMAKDGRVLDVSLSISPIHDAAGKVVGASKIAHDITERKRREAELTRLLESEQEARAEAEKAIRTRDEFLSIAAHELKTPITSLRGFAQTLIRQLSRDGTLNPTQAQKALSHIDKQTVKLTVLINQLLDVSRIEAGRLSLERTPTNITELVQGVIDQAQATGQSHAITFQAEPSVILNVDPLRFEQVMRNLLDNAIKYSPANSSIAIDITRPNSDEVRISVTDLGMGVDPEHRDKIFQRFYQAHIGGAVEGMGLGLYISRQIIELHGGQLSAEWPETGGTRFIITLPTHTSENRA